MLPPAPPRLSITTGCPRPSLTFCPTRRATPSAKPPAANATTTRTGFVGYCWPHAVMLRRAAAQASALRTGGSVMVSPRFGFGEFYNPAPIAGRASSLLVNVEDLLEARNGGVRAGEHLAARRHGDARGGAGHGELPQHQRIARTYLARGGCDQAIVFRALALLQRSNRRRHGACLE